MCGELRGATRQEMRDFIMGKPIPPKPTGNVVELLSPSHDDDQEQASSEQQKLAANNGKAAPPTGAAIVTTANQQLHDSINNKENKENGRSQIAESSSASSNHIHKSTGVVSFLVKNNPLSTSKNNEASESSTTHERNDPATAAVHPPSTSRQTPANENLEETTAKPSKNGPLSLQQTRSIQQPPSASLQHNAAAAIAGSTSQNELGATVPNAPSLSRSSNQTVLNAACTTVAASARSTKAINATTTTKESLQKTPQQRTPFTMAKIQSFSPGPVPCCPETMSTWIYPQNPKYEIREYQYKITETALFHNTLVSLPTGLGKTLIAAVVLYNYYRWFPTGKVVFLAPTLPLVHQQVDACFKIMGLPEQHTALLTGKMPPHERSAIWRSHRVFYCTPQTVQKDWASQPELAKSVVCIVLDEAHKASGDYAYVKVLDQLEGIGAKFRIVGLSATPGTTIKGIQNVIHALRSVKLEVRSEEDEEVKQYLHNKHTEIIVVPKNNSQKEVEKMLNDMVSPYLKALRDENALPKRFGTDATISAYHVHKARGDYFQRSDAKGYMHGIFTVAHKLISLRFEAHQSLTTVKGKLVHLKNNLQRGHMGKLVKSTEFCELFELVVAATTTTTSGTSETSYRNTPKLAKLSELLKEHFARAKACDKSSRAIVFSQFRESVKEIVQVLGNLKNEMIRPRHFVGQSKGSSTNNQQQQQQDNNNPDDNNGDENCVSLDGMKQAEQQKVIKQFRNDEYNVLVCTCIGEEGLDIGEVDLIVNYDMLRSPIRMIQRTGRTGRARDGRVVSLISEGQEEKTYLQAQSSQKTLLRALKSKSQFVMNEDQPMFPRQLPKVEKRTMEISSQIHLSQVIGAGVNNQKSSAGSGGTERIAKKKKKKSSGGTGGVKSWKLTAVEEEERRQQLGEIVALNDVSWKALRRTFLRGRARAMRKPEGRNMRILRVLEERWPLSSHKERSHGRGGGNVSSVQNMFPLQQSCGNDKLQYIDEKLPCLDDTSISRVSAALIATNHVDEANISNGDRNDDDPQLQPSEGTRSPENSTPRLPPSTSISKQLLPSTADAVNAETWKNQVLPLSKVREKEADVPSYQHNHEVLRNPYAASVSTIGLPNRPATSKVNLPVRNPYSTAISTSTTHHSNKEAANQTAVANSENGIIPILQESETSESHTSPVSCAPPVNQTLSSTTTLKNDLLVENLPKHVETGEASLPQIQNHINPARYKGQDVASSHEKVSAESQALRAPTRLNNAEVAPTLLSSAVEPIIADQCPSLSESEVARSHDNVAGALTMMPPGFRLPSPAPSSSSSSEEEEDDDDDSDSQCGTINQSNGSMPKTPEIETADNNGDGGGETNEQISFRLPTQDSSSSSDDESESESEKSKDQLLLNGVVASEDSDSEEDIPLASLRKRKEQPPVASTPSKEDTSLATAGSNVEREDVPLSCLRKRKTKSQLSSGLEEDDAIPSAEGFDDEGDIPLSSLRKRKFRSSTLQGMKKSPSAVDEKSFPSVDQKATANNKQRLDCADNKPEEEVIDIDETPLAPFVKKSVKKRRHIMQTQSSPESQFLANGDHSPLYDESSPETGVAGICGPAEGRAKTQSFPSSSNAGALVDTPMPVAGVLGHGSALTNTPAGASQNDGTICAVCYSPDENDADPIIFCDGKCGNAYHVSCYGITTDVDSFIRSEQPWSCDKCTYIGDANDLVSTCLHCSNSDGPLKRNSKREWYHPLCSDFLAEGDQSLPCVLCDKGGATKCFSCGQAAHPHCAVRECTDGKWTLIRTGLSKGKSAIFCPNHIEQANTFLAETNLPGVLRLIQTRQDKLPAKKLFVAKDTRNGAVPSSITPTVKPSAAMNDESEDHKHQLLQRRREVLNRFVVLEAENEDDDDDDSAEDGIVRRIEGEELSQNSFINDSTLLTQHFSQDELGAVDPDASTEIDFQHRAVDAQHERDNQFTTPLLNRRMKKRDDSQNSCPSQRGLGNMHFVRSVLEHHRSGGDAAEIESLYHKVAKADNAGEPDTPQDF